MHALNHEAAAHPHLSVGREAGISFHLHFPGGDSVSDMSVSVVRGRESMTGGARGACMLSPRSRTPEADPDLGSDVGATRGFRARMVGLDHWLNFHFTRRLDGWAKIQYILYYCTAGCMFEEHATRESCTPSIYPLGSESQVLFCFSEHLERLLSPGAAERSGLQIVQSLTCIWGVDAVATVVAGAMANERTYLSKETNPRIGMPYL
jgi:hypothetical protein